LYEHLSLDTLSRILPSTCTIEDTPILPET
jgi:hypothetical protein